MPSLTSNSRHLGFHDCCRMVDGNHQFVSQRYLCKFLPSFTTTVVFISMKILNGHDILISVRFPWNTSKFVLLHFLSIWRMHAERIHRVGTTPFVSQVLQTRDINAFVILDFKVNTAKVLIYICYWTRLLSPYCRSIGAFVSQVYEATPDMRRPYTIFKQFMNSYEALQHFII